MEKTLQETIESVNGVEKCRIVEEDGHISQVFIEASLRSNDDEGRVQEIKGIVRSVVGAVNLNHNLELDYRKVKVVEYKPESDGCSEVHPRIQIAAAYQRRAPVSESIVELCCLQKTYLGKSRLTRDIGLSTFNAFCDAFHQMDFGQLKLVYFHTLSNTFAQERLVLVKVLYTGLDCHNESLVGVAEIQEDLPLAVVRASLSAVNRRIVLVT